MMFAAIYNPVSFRHSGKLHLATILPDGQVAALTYCGTRWREMGWSQVDVPESLSDSQVPCVTCAKSARGRGVELPWEHLVTVPGQ